jgi:hypothetical protein
MEEQQDERAVGVLVEEKRAVGVWGAERKAEDQKDKQSLLPVVAAEDEEEESAVRRRAAERGEEDAIKDEAARVEDEEQVQEAKDQDDDWTRSHYKTMEPQFSDTDKKIVLVGALQRQPFFKKATRFLFGGGKRVIFVLRQSLRNCLGGRSSIACL